MRKQREEQRGINIVTKYLPEVFLPPIRPYWSQNRNDSDEKTLKDDEAELSTDEIDIEEEEEFEDMDGNRLQAMTQDPALSAMNNEVRL